MKRFVLYKGVIWLYADGTVRGEYIAIYDRIKDRYAIYTSRQERLAHSDMEDLNKYPEFEDDFVWRPPEVIR